jgi:uncharacterized MAPEG superfamily protein
LIGQMIQFTRELLELRFRLRTACRVGYRTHARGIGNGFTPDNASLSPFTKRLARAHANCVEGLPIFGGLLAIAIMTSRTSVTDALAPWFLGARLLQSIIHLVSTSSIAASLRFAAFAVRMAIAVYWSIKLMA